MSPALFFVQRKPTFSLHSAHILMRTRDIIDAVLIAQASTDLARYYRALEIASANTATADRVVAPPVRPSDWAPAWQSPDVLANIRRMNGADVDEDRQVASVATENRVKANAKALSLRDYSDNKRHVAVSAPRKVRVSQDAVTAIVRLLDRERRIVVRRWMDILTSIFGFEPTGTDLADLCVASGHVVVYNGATLAKFTHGPAFTIDSNLKTECYRLGHADQVRELELARKAETDDELSARLRKMGF